MSELLRPELISLMESKGWRGLTSLQLKAARPILAGYNVLITAPTGEGKTEAAMLPLLTKLINENSVEPISILYITPMRALINDLYRRLTFWAAPFKLRVAKKHSDVPSSERYSRLRSPPHILLITPESLEIDMDWAPKFKEYYKNVKAVVVDEVHELLSSKRGAQLMLLLERLKAMAGDFQRIGLSATIGDPAKALEVLKGSSKRPSVVVSDEGSRKFSFELAYVNADDPWPKVADTVISYSEGPTLVFTNSRYVSEKLGHELQKRGLNNVYVHHSSVSAEVRESIEEGLRRGSDSIVVCTKTLELGIDVGSIRRIIQVRAPGSVSALLQRTGRSYHRLGGTSNGVVIATDPVDYIEALAEIRLASRGYVESEVIDSAPIDVIAKEVVGSSLMKGHVMSPEELYAALSGSPLFKLSHEEFHQLLKYLESNGLVKLDGNKVRVGGTFYHIWRLRPSDEKGWGARDFGDFFSTIPKRDMFVVKSDDKTIGYVDAYFVYRNLRVGDTIRLAGETWNVIRIDENLEQVLVSPSQGSAEVPLWRGEGLSRSREVAREFYSIIFTLGEGPANDTARSIVDSISRWYTARGVRIDERNLVYERVGDEHVILYPFGSKVAETLSAALMYLMIKRRGLDVHYRSSFYGISVTADTADLLEVLKSVDANELSQLLENALDYLPTFYENLAEAKYDLGKVGEVDRERDSFLIAHLKRDIIRREFDVAGAVSFLNALRGGLIRVHVLSDGPSPLSKSLLSTPSVRPWIQDLGKRLARALKDWAFTSIELSDELNLPEKTVTNKLKDMRRPEYGELRVVAFLDVNSDEWRWTLLSSFTDIANSEDFSESFTPLRLDEEYRVSTKKAYNWGSRESIVKVRDVMTRWQDIKGYVACSDELYEVKVSQSGGLNDDFERYVVYHYVNADYLREIILNAIAYLQRRPGPSRRLAV